MNQTFYIDVDEEISSIIDRLNRSMSGDNYFVVPKRAIFLQSIVNLKLLQREADKVGKRIIIITQDEMGASMAKRLDIDTFPSLEGLKINLDEYQEDDSQEYYEENIYDQVEIAAKREQSKPNRLSNVGSEDFYITDENKQSFKKSPEIKKDPPRSISINHISAAKNVIERRNQEGDTRSDAPQTKVYKTIDTRNSARRNYVENSQKSYSQLDKLDMQKEKTLEKMFSSSEARATVKSKEKNNNNKEKKSGKFFLFFVAVCVFALVSVAGYLFLPSAKIIIIPNILKNKIDADVSSSDSLEEGEMKIGVRVIEKEENISLVYDVKGENQKSGKKAHGNVVIYNEYSGSSQPLVATTRLESENGKIFRLVKGITVPGTTKVGNETKPGAIEAEVIADQAGEDYNIESSKFTIPGFKDGPKFEKFYAKSADAMTGGSSDGIEEIGSVGMISKADIDNAKEKTEVALREKIAKIISEELDSGEIALPQAEKITITKTAAASKVGDMTNSFNYSASASVKTIVFSEEEIKKIIKEKAEKQGKTEKTDEKISKIEYVTVEPDFEKSLLKMKVRGEITSVPVIDSEQIKKELLGEKTDQFNEILKQYSSIKNVNVEFNLPLISSVPQFEHRVTLEIRNE